MDHREQDTKPKPCPFCGNPHPDVISWIEDGRKQWRVVCLPCLHSHRDSEDDAIRAWNRAAVQLSEERPSLPPDARLLLELEACETEVKLLRANRDLAEAVFGMPLDREHIQRYEQLQHERDEARKELAAVRSVDSLRPPERLYSPRDIDSSLRLAADEWDAAIKNGLHEVGIPVSEILRSLAADATAVEAPPESNPWGFALDCRDLYQAERQKRIADGLPEASAHELGLMAVYLQGKSGARFQGGAAVRGADSVAAPEETNT